MPQRVAHVRLLRTIASLDETHVSLLVEAGAFLYPQRKVCAGENEASVYVCCLCALHYNPSQGVRISFKMAPNDYDVHLHTI